MENTQRSFSKVYTDQTPQENRYLAFMKKVKITLPWRRESLSEVGAVPAVGAKNLTLYLGDKRSHTLLVGYRSLAYTAVLQIFGPLDLFHRGFLSFLVYPICFHETVCDKWCLHESVRNLENGVESGFVKHWLNSV